MMGAFHTITLSDDGVVHSFWRKFFFTIRFRINGICSIMPTPIPNFPKIKQIACGSSFTLRGRIPWSFGGNEYGQLGIGNIIDYKVPRKVQNIPPVLSVFCGGYHTFIITNDSNLWSCGLNDYGQCINTDFGNVEYVKTFQKTNFFNIVTVSLGGNYSMFQNEQGEMFACGRNDNGVLGLGNFCNQFTPTLIPDLPANIIQIVSGHNLFLDSEGNVFSVGCNLNGQLGVGNCTNQNVLNQISNIPPIQTISCGNISSYLVDFEGNVWSFGGNDKGQLGHGDTTSRNVPTKIESLKDIRQNILWVLWKPFSCKRSSK